MVQSSRSRYLVATLALLATAAGGSPAAAETTLSLAEALARAESDNPELSAAAWGVRAAEAQTASAGRAAWWPRLGMRTGYSLTDNPAQLFAGRVNSGDLSPSDMALDELTQPDHAGVWNSALTLTVPLDLAGASGESAAAARAGAAAQDHDRAEAVLAIRLAVTDAYRRAHLAQQAVAVTERALAVAKSREQQLESRVAEGAALNVDLLRARTRRRQREADVAARHADTQVAQASLGRLLGQSIRADYVGLEAPGPVGPLTESLPMLLERALHTRPGLHAAAQRAAAASRAVSATNRSRWPRAVLLAQLQDDRLHIKDGQQSTLIGGQLEWDLFDPQHGPRREAADAAAGAAQALLRAAADQIRAEVTLAYSRATAAREQHAAASGGTEDGEEALHVIQERRGSGVATLTDELETEAAMYVAQLEELRAATEVAVADAALWRAVGTL